MVIVGFEGLGGSGKSTLIRLIKKISPVLSMRECRSEPPCSCDVDQWYLNENLRVFDKYVNNPELRLFDRSFIATLGVTYAKMRSGAITPQRHREFLREVGGRQLDGLVLCIVPMDVALHRRNRRDGLTHPLWGDPAMMAYFDEFMRNEADRYACRTRVMGTGTKLTDENIVQLHGWIHAIPGRE